jgi:putative transposase
VAHRRDVRHPRSYPAAKADIPDLVNVKHVFVKAAARVNNRAENSHQPTRERERRMRGFRDPKRTQAFVSSFGPIRQHFALKRHLLRASLYRKHLADGFVAWREFTNVAQTPSNAFRATAPYGSSSTKSHKLTVPTDLIRFAALDSGRLMGRTSVMR